MSARTILACLSGLAAGVAFTIEAFGTASDSVAGGVLLHTAARLFPLLCVTLISMGVLKRWITASELIREELDRQLIEQKQKFAQDSERRNAELDARETRLARATETHQTQMATLVERLTTSDSALTEERRLHNQLQDDFAVLADDFNRVVQQALQDRADVFARRTGTSTPTPRTTATVPHPADPPRPTTRSARPVTPPAAATHVEVQRGV